jgi:hypothetical protein
MSSDMSAVLAHYGGVDEIGVFVVPVVAAILILRWAERRARHKTEGDDHDSEGDGERREGQVEAPPAER